MEAQLSFIGLFWTPAYEWPISMGDIRHEYYGNIRWSRAKNFTLGMWKTIDRYNAFSLRFSICISDIWPKFFVLLAYLGVFIFM